MTQPFTETRPRRILFVIEKLAQRSGGAERVLIETANALALRGHSVEIVSHEFRGKPPFYPLAPGVIQSNLRPPRRGIRRVTSALRNYYQERAPDMAPFDRLTWLSRNGGFWRRLGAHLAATRPDVAIAFMPPAITALGLARCPAPLRRVASMHNAPEQDFHNPLRWDPSALDRRRRWQIMDRMDRIAVLLPEYRDFYSAGLKDRVLVLPNAVTAVDPARIAAAERRPVVMSVGRLATVKRHELLIEAWARIAPAFPQWELRIFGEGPLKEALTARIRALGLSSIHLMGHRKDVGQQYLRSAILAHPAEFEGFPLAVTEALASGLPVVGFADCSGLNRLVRNGENGLLVSAGGDRQESYAAALAGLMGDERARARLGAAGPESVASYSPSQVIDQWEEMLFGTDPVPPLEGTPG